MNQRQQELRRAAAEAFAQSLDHLSKTLNEQPETPPEPTVPKPAPPRAKKAFDLADLEAAAADIEQFMESRQKNSDV